LAQHHGETVNPQPFQPQPHHKFTFGLWTVGNRGRDPFGDFVRPPISPIEIVHMLSEVGAWGVNLHDNDLVPIGATSDERDAIVRDFKQACKQAGLVVPMATVSLFFHPVFRDGAFTSNDPEVRAYALQKTMRAMDLGAELGAKIFVLWGGREGVETDACRRADEAVKRLREAVNFLCEYSIDRKYGFQLALEAKPNEPRADIYMATTGHYLGFIPTLDHPEMVGVNPEVAHEQMAGLNFMHGVAQAWEAGKLFHIDLNDQAPGRFDQDLRFGSCNLKSAFWLVKFLEDVGYQGPRHFDAHAYRTEDYPGVKDFARGCMRTYLILKEKAIRWNADPEVQAILREISAAHPGIPHTARYSHAAGEALLAHNFDKEAIMKKRLPYEHLDQLTIDILTGTR
jgi:xylose isomerase